MKRRFGPSLYFANDKVIFDSLNQHQVKVDLIRELLSERGILVSAHTPKEELAQYFSRLTADYFDHQSIASKLGSVAKKERITYSEIKEPIEQNIIIDSLNALKKTLEEQGSNIHIDVKNDRVVALISYEHIDYTKIDFKQVEPRDAIIEFAKESSGHYVVRSTQNSYIDAAVSQIFSEMGATTGTSIVPVRMSLESHADPRVRTQFFESLIKNIFGYKFQTVTDAYCYKPKLAAAIGDDDSDKELEESPHVERVALRGEGVNKSFVIADLYKNGYYIVKVAWRVRLAEKSDSDVYELEAQFSKPDSCTDFSYQAKSAIISEDGKLTKKRRGLKKEEQDALIRLIEQSAKKAYSSI